MLKFPFWLNSLKYYPGWAILFSNGSLVKLLYQTWLTNSLLLNWLAQENGIGLYPASHSVDKSIGLPDPKKYVLIVLGNEEDFFI